MQRSNDMKCHELIRELEALYPPAAAEPWDNSGLQLGSLDADLSRVLVTLDVTDEAVDEAIQCEADLILAHHPLIFSPIKRVTEDDLAGRRILKLARAGISCYAMHTNYDVCRMAELNAAQLSLRDTEVLMETASKEEESQGIGRVGFLPSPLGLSDLCQLIKERLKIPALRCYGETDEMIRRVAISGGSGKGMTTYAIKAGAQVLVTGDVDYHSAIDAAAMGLCVIDAGHYGTEYCFIEDVAKTTRALAPGVDVRCLRTKHPFVVC